MVHVDNSCYRSVA